ncbi:ROK family protein [Cellulomonas sp. URHD0024]|uniref:ROK family protein n=1 Tax=Cellulomonas sp. URHD0024 TaxID=1302620 RepID=UPI0004887BDC|nr:ROK family protein [Cellulomonas sp. URHD0024]
MTTRAWTIESGTALDVALEVLLRGPLSRAELARRLDLSQATLSRLTKPLVEQGLLIEGAARQDSAAGRPGQPLDVDASSHTFGGVTLTGEAAHIVLVDLRGTVLATQHVPLPSHHSAAVVEQVADTLDAIVRDHSDASRLAGIGVGLGGHAPDRSTVRVAPFLGWQDVPFGSMLAQATGLPCVVENDVAALTAAEHWFGGGRDVQRFALLTVGAGVGYGLVVDNRVVTHEDMGLGLVGHFPLDPNGPLCPEGHRGCARSMLTIESLTRQASLAHGRSINYDELMGLAVSGDPAARRLVDDAATGLGHLVAAVANLTMPERIVLSGEGVALATVGAEALHTAIAADRDPRASTLDIVVRPGDFSQWARGAAVVAIQDFVLRSR